MAWLAAVAVGSMVGAAGQAGRFGRWTVDPVGLPAFVYTCNQRADPAARLPVGHDRTARAKGEHTFQLGNDRVVVLASNYGQVRVRQDEGSAKLLNDANEDDPDGWRHGGGFGYLFDVTEAEASSADTQERRAVLSTHFSANADVHRQFGIGYRSITAVRGW